MGTETDYFMDHDMWADELTVKKNNPLMGTETRR